MKFPYIWTEKKTEMLEKLYPSMSNTHLAKKMNIPERVIRSKALKLGLRKDVHYWSIEEDGIILANLGNVSVSEIVPLLNDKTGKNRSYYAVYDRIKVLDGRRKRKVLPEILLLKKAKKK